MAHGKTLQLNNIRPKPPLWVHQHHGKPASERRKSRNRITGAVRTWPSDLRAPATNTPYVNPQRDLKRHRWWKLRPERQIELAIQLAEFRAKRDAGGKHRR
jgi:hypothetical protein